MYYMHRPRSLLAQTCARPCQAWGTPSADDCIPIPDTSSSETPKLRVCHGASGGAPRPEILQSAELVPGLGQRRPRHGDSDLPLLVTACHPIPVGISRTYPRNPHWHASATWVRYPGLHVSALGGISSIRRSTGARASHGPESAPLTNKLAVHH